MIDKKYGKYVLVCDLCYEEYGSFDTFQDAVKYKKDYEWTSVKIDGEWMDICRVFNFEGGLTAKTRFDK